MPTVHVQSYLFACGEQRRPPSLVYRSAPDTSAIAKAYDVLTTLPKERQVIWSKKPTFVTLLYLICR